MPTERRKARDGMCKATTKAGHQCAAPAIRGGKLCSLHADPTRAAELGRKGGMGNRHVYRSDAEDVVLPQSASDVKQMLAEAMAAIRAGKMNPKLGTVLGYLGSSLLKAMEVVDFEQRLERLEETSHGLASPTQADRKTG